MEIRILIQFIHSFQSLRFHFVSCTTKRNQPGNSKISQLRSCYSVGKLAGSIGRRYRYRLQTRFQLQTQNQNQTHTPTSATSTIRTVCHLLTLTPPSPSFFASSSNCSVSKYSTNHSMSATITTELSSSTIRMDPFCLKQFLPSSTGGQHIPIPCSPDEFVTITNKWFSENEAQAALKDGYAPFCKHLFIPIRHFPFASGLPCAYAAITDENKSKLESMYAARTEKELPVLTRYFAKGSVTPAPATYVDVILYSRQQIEKENEAMKSQPSISADAASKEKPILSPQLNTIAGDSSNWSWGIVSIKPQDVDYETPMNPITIMRNSLGVSEGGSGVALNREAYMKSVAFWQAHALLQ